MEKAKTGTSCGLCGNQVAQSIPILATGQERSSKASGEPKDRVMVVSTYVPGAMAKGNCTGGTSALIEAASWVDDEDVPCAIGRAARAVLHEMFNAQPGAGECDLPHPWCWGDCIETIADAPSQLGLFGEYGVRVLHVVPNACVLDNDEAVIFDLDE